MDTEFGFKFGSMQVTRINIDEKTGVAIISVDTPKAKISIRATKTGLVKFYDLCGNELKLVSKDMNRATIV